VILPWQVISQKQKKSQVSKDIKSKQITEIALLIIYGVHVCFTMINNYKNHVPGHLVKAVLILYKHRGDIFVTALNKPKASV